MFVGAQNPRFVQGVTYEPLNLNIPLLGALAGEAPRNIEETGDESDGVHSGKASFEQQRGPMTEDQLTSKKRRTIRFLE